MKKNLTLIKVAELGKAGASVFSKLAIDSDPSLSVKKPKVETPKVETEVKKIKPPIKPKTDAYYDSIKKDIMKKDPVFKSKIDSMNTVHRADSLKLDKEFKNELRQIHVADSLRADANREAFVQDSTNYGGIIARIKRTLGF